jgi:hypothetical protein
MKLSVKKAIESYIERFLQHLINKYGTESVKSDVLKKATFDERKGEYKPFHQALIPSELLRIQRFFRSFSTSLGQGVFEFMAKVVAESNEKWVDVKLKYKFLAFASPNIQSAVDTFIENILTGKIKPYPYPKFPEPESQDKKRLW